MLSVFYFLAIVIHESLVYIKYKNLKLEKFGDIVNVRNFPVLAFIQILLTLLQFYFYYTGIETQKKVESDSFLFNKSFTLYKKGIFFIISLFILGILWASIYLYFDF